MKTKNATEKNYDISENKKRKGSGRRLQKGYLFEQIHLMSLRATDFLTEEEVSRFNKVGENTKLLQAAETKEEKQSLRQKRESLLADFRSELEKNSGKLRRLLLSSVLDSRCMNQTGPATEHALTWEELKPSRRISEFVSEQARLLGLKNGDVTFDKIIVEWKSPELFSDIVKHGVELPFKENGAVVWRTYHVRAASAGQMRTDKLQLFEDSAWERICSQLECGLTWKKINEKGGINVNKYLAYISLTSGATKRWNVDIDKVIVVDDFENKVKAFVRWINHDYTFEDGEREVSINQTDGVGFALPKVFGVLTQAEGSQFYVYPDGKGSMIRAPWIKGYLCVADFIGFCASRGVEAKIKDIYGKEHDLIAEDIQIILTKSQFKMYKYYKDWEEYKKYFKELGCWFCKTNEEEPFAKNTEINYQMLQTLVDMTDGEIEEFIRPEKDQINKISTSVETMLRAVKAKPDAKSPQKRCLALYPELLWDEQIKSTLKNIRLRKLTEAKSGAIRCRNKRLFVVPDPYAVFERWFLGEENPKGILARGEVYANAFRKREKVALCRSPHLSMEWVVQRIAKNEQCAKVFLSNAIYVSVDSVISRVMQFDCDGDMLNVFDEKILIDVAERNLKNRNIVPLYYEASKADPTELSQEEIYNALWRAHMFSNIGEISNMLTRLWNNEQFEEKDDIISGLLCYLNNLVIDGAKTGKVNRYDAYPEIKKLINSRIGGRNSKMPYFFQYSKNARAQLVEKGKTCKFAPANDSTMNRISRAFDDVKQFSMAKAKLPPFNYEMLIDAPHYQTDKKAVRVFCDVCAENRTGPIAARKRKDWVDWISLSEYDLLADKMLRLWNENGCSIKDVFASVTKYLFAGGGINKKTGKSTYWAIFGPIAEKNLIKNLKTASRCPKCGTLVPAWSSHACPKPAGGFGVCVDCGSLFRRINSKQIRCESCQTEYRQLYKTNKNKEYYTLKKEGAETA